MKAVNLIPQTERRGASAVSRSGGGAYLVLGTLAALVLMMAVYAVEGGRINSKQAEAAQATREATALQAKSNALQQYSAFAGLKDARVDTVTQIAGERFDWSNTLHDLARVIPPNTWLTCLKGTVTPAVSVVGCGGGGGSTTTVRAAITAPAIELTGCTTSQPGVARMMAKMRNIDDVTRVTLVSSEKNEEASATGSGDSSGSSTDCRRTDQYPQFGIVVFFKPLPGQAAASTASSGAVAPAPTATTGASQ